jgi:hypothetical protein
MTDARTLQTTPRQLEGVSALYSALALDASGSMAGVAKDALTAVADHIDALAAQPKTSRTTLVLFDDEIEVMQRNALAGELEYITRQQFDDHGGGTRLYDAVAEAIRLLEEDHRSGAAVMVAVVTDGQDTSSTINAERLKRIIGAKKELGWKFTYIGPGGAPSGAHLGFEPGDCFALEAGGEGMRKAIAAVTDRTVKGLLGTGDARVIQL